jgi:hypothetical protein
VAQVSLKFAGMNAPWLPNGKPEDLTLSAIPIQGGRPGAPIEALFEGESWRVELPGHWYGCRWPFGWNRSGGSVYFRLQAAARPDNLVPYEKYDVQSLRAANGQDIFKASIAGAPLLGAWRVEETAFVHRTEGLRLNIYVDDLGGLARRAGTIDHVDVTATVDGQQALQRSLPAIFSRTEPLGRDLDLDRRTPGYVTVYAKVGNFQTRHWITLLVPSKDPAEVHLAFPAVMGGVKRRAVPGETVHFPAFIADRHAPIYMNDQLIHPLVTGDTMTLTLPKGQLGLDRIEVQPWGRPRTTIAEIDVLPPPKPPAQLAYEALLDKRDNEAASAASKIPPSEQALSIAIKAYVFTRAVGNVDKRDQMRLLADPMRRFQQAVTATDRSPDHRGHALALVGMGLIKEVGTGDYVGAQDLYDQALRLSPRLAIVIFNYASMLNDTGRHPQAVALVQAAIRNGAIRPEERKLALVSELLDMVRPQ